nr:MAG TPA: Invertebrate innate immunity transcript family [Caudoviricetes sp.]
MDDKITTLVAIVGIAVAISKEAREWYKTTKKEKRQKPTRKRRR